jgi:hypothetical protein
MRFAEDLQGIASISVLCRKGKNDIWLRSGEHSAGELTAVRENDSVIDD